MPLNVAKAAKYLDDNAEPASTGKCATYVRRALEAGGVVINPHPVFARDYGPALVVNGFKPVAMKDYAPQAGDVVVIQPYAAGNAADGKSFKASDPAGHIAMFDGTIWVSDFKQRDMVGGPGYRAHATGIAVYRP